MVQQFSADVQGVEPELPVNFVFNGKAYVGLQTSSPQSLEMADAGLIPKYDLELTVRLNQFVTPIVAPVSQDPVSIGTVNYRISNANASQDGVVNVYHLVQQS